MAPCTPVTHPWHHIKRMDRFPDTAASSLKCDRSNFAFSIRSMQQVDWGSASRKQTKQQTYIYTLASAHDAEKNAERLAMIDAYDFPSPGNQTAFLLGQKLAMPAE